MKKVFPLLFAALVAVLILTSCSAKLFVIRPTLISKIAIENLSTGESTELLRDQTDETDWLMDDLIFEMAEFYKRDGDCSDSDGHLYKAVFYNDDRLELSVIINEDGSVCKNNGHYVLSDPEDSEIEAFNELWEKAFESGRQD
ncbi:MAG: hypothetical protein JW780_03785 [Clostridiales bacterium]|nr:hypothetical protein [Clostridiales bacterium]